ncbi:MAG: bifunctional sulfate adenylyltransferase/adenylylsulfate kinase [Kineosporiaceae bacterium]
MSGGLVSPHGGLLIDLVVEDDRARELKKLSVDWPGWDLTPRQTCDLELLATGGFSPLRGFMGRADYDSVCSSMRLADGTLWPMPIVLDVSEQLAATLGPGTFLALRDPEGFMLAALQVEEVWTPDRRAEAQAVFGTTDTTHPGVAATLGANPCYVSGHLEVVAVPAHYDYRARRHTPAQLRAEFQARGWSKVVAFQTRNPMHRAHLELTLRAAKESGANLLVHPVVGLTKPGDVDHYTRVRCYEAVMSAYPEGTAMLSLLPLAMRMGGPREALWHAIIRKNHGVSHLIVGRDHAGPGADSEGRPFYGPYDAQELVREHSVELGVEMVPFRNMVYLADSDSYVPDDEVPAGAPVLSISGTQQRDMLQRGEELPAWFTPPAVAEELRRSYPSRAEQGLTVFFTGLSGSGKSTIANILLVKLLERSGRNVSMLDGDHVRRHLSTELGFSKEHRDLNSRRIGYVASEITKNGGIAVCAPIAPYDATRQDVRRQVERCGGFVLVHVATSVEECERRDRKGLYAKARAGILKEFTGISDPYELPEDAEVVLPTERMSPEESAEKILAYLEDERYLRAGGR